ncbi:MAG: TonB-dependent receptor [Pseudomonadota bacterium]
MGRIPSSCRVPSAFRFRITIAIAASVLAQTPTTVVAASDDDASGIIEEVVVTSRRREESQQDVPLSVTAFGAEAIERLQPQTLRDFDGIAPNVYIGMNTAGPGASALFIRGVGYADIEKTQTPQVGVIVDGIQIGSSTGQLIDVFDVESIEVNRGPQGVLFGKNTIGGNIVVNRVRPQFNEFGFNAAVEGGNFDMRNIKGRINIPLVDDTLALKIGAINRQRDGYYDNETIGGTSGDVDFSSQTAALRWQPTDRFDAILTYDRIDDTSQTLPQDPRFDGDNRFETLADKREPTEYNVNQLGLRMEWDLNDRETLYSITGWHDSDEAVNQDFDGADLGGLAVPFAQLHTLREQDFRVFTQEVRADFAVNDQLDILVGGYFYDSEQEFQQRTNNVLQLPPVALSLPTGLSCGAAGLRANPIAGDAICQVPNARSLQRASEDVESRAIFGSVNYRPTDALEFALGIRFLEEEKDFSNAYFDFSDGTFDTVPTSQEFQFVNTLAATAGAAFGDSDDWDDTLITASANWAFSDSSRLYATYAEGFRSGGFSIRSADPNTSTFQPEDAEQIELGIKTDLFDRRLRLNLALFRLERDGNQFSSIITLPPGSIPGTTTVINNGGAQTIDGIEAEMSWSINDYFTFNLSGGFLDIQEDEFALPCDVVDGCQTPTPGVLDPSGTLRVFPEDDTSRQPDFNIATSLVFQRQLGPGLLTANVQYKENGDFIITETGSTARTRVVEEGYSDVSASIAWERTYDSGDIVKVILWGKNLTDEEWKEQALLLGPNPATGFQGWGAPRTYALELQWSR